MPLFGRLQFPLFSILAQLRIVFVPNRGKNLAKNKDAAPSRIAVCIPTWNLQTGPVKILEKIFAKADASGYTPLALFDKQNHYSYKRAGAFVTREIVVFEKK